jgi:glycosyltransferase involved in cell wall biosynthesis
MKIAMLTPLPPTRSGVAHYSSLLLPALRERVDVRAFDASDEYRSGDFAQHIYQLGNNPHHERMYVEAMRVPGVAVVHDLVLHHLIVEMTLARGDVDGYVSALAENHGEAGAAWARGRAAGLHSEMGNFLLPASVAVARRSRAVIVHNEYARDRLLSFGVETPIHVVPHPWIPAESQGEDGMALRRQLGIDAKQRVIGFFGFLTSAKRAEVVLEAFRIARQKDARLVLLVVGEPAPNIDPETLAGEGIVTTGYVGDDDFPRYYAVADRLVNLRYPSAGETSGTLIRAFDAGKPVAVSDYAQFAEFPGDCVFKVPLGEGEVEQLVDFFTRELPEVAAAQRRWLESSSTLDQTIDGYLAALRDSVSAPARDVRSAIAGSIPLFPQLELVSSHVGDEVSLVVRNGGDATIRTRTYGQPEYRLIAKLFDGGRVVQDRWLALPCDLAPGASAAIVFTRTAPATSLRLYHALQDVPMLEPQAWAEVGDVQ